MNPANGNIIVGARIGKHRFVGRMMAAQLFQLAPDPRKESKDALRHQVQREFEGAKKKNVAPYAEYLVDLAHGKAGQAPAITLYTAEDLDIEEREDGSAQLQIPWDVRLTALDGETQLAARYEALQAEPETRHEMVPVDISWAEPPQWARQVFHDLNVLGVKPSVSLGLSMDERDSLTAACRAVERAVPFFTGRVNAQRRQLRKSDKEVVTVTGLRGACATLAKGIAGISYGTKAVPMEPEQEAVIERAAIDWLTAVTKLIGGAIADRDTAIAGANSVLAAIGAIGHKLTFIEDDEARKLEAEQLAERYLRPVIWTRNGAWVGIAGKMTPKGRLTVGGTKEAAYAIHAALIDEGSEPYRRVRGKLAVS